MTTSEIPKAYEPAAVEAKWYSRWLEADCFKADPARVTASRPAFSIVIPPPNITGVLTLGHVLNNTIQDILVRRARMTGHETLWLPGTDHAGLATQSAVERSLRKNEKITRRDLGREEFLRRTWEWQQKHGGIIIEQLKRLGCSCDWSRQRFTLDADYAAAVQRVFVDLHDKGYIYRGLRMVNWDPAALTALSDEEVISTPRKSALYYVRYEVVTEPGRFLEVATTRPETIMGDTALAVHPDDERYRDLVGKEVWRPFPREALPVIGDAQIDPAFGTGALKVTPAHDKVDFEIGRRHNLPTLDVLHPDGRINCPAVPELDGLDRFAARKKAVEMLAELGLLSKEEPYENNVGYSERSEVPIEPRLSEQWFLRYPKTDEALAVVREHLIRFYPAHWEKVYAQWLENIQDWCISRQVWWGHRVPAWYRQREGEEGPEIRVQIESPGEGWTQDEDTLDTWFSSWLWAYETMDPATRAKFYPTDVLVTGPDIIFFWVARMIIAGLEFKPGADERPESNIPFRNVYFTGLIRDAKGKKMSKSLGNSPDVVEMIDKYGADGVRFGLLRIAPQGQDIRFDEKQIEEGRNFANKIWNAARFYQMQEPALPFGTRISYRPAPYVLDIEAKLRETQVKVEAAYKEFRFSEMAQALYDFFWSDYCDWFVEAAKADILDPAPEVNSESEAHVTGHAIRKHVALFTMYRVLTEFLRLLHPYMPHLTEELNERLTFPPRPSPGAPIAPAASEEPAAPDKPRRKSQFLMHQRLGGLLNLSGTTEEVAAAQRLTADFYETVRLARNLRAEYNIATNKPARFTLRLREETVSAIERDALPYADCLRALKRMINAEDLALNPDYQPPRGTPSALTPLGELFLPLAGLVNVEAERARLQKEAAKTEAEFQAAERKLSSEQFVANAPAEVVEEHRRRLTDSQAKLAKLRGMLAALED
jgi:valyl-tRNA synthetase